MTAEQELVALKDLVKRMRDAQKDYFATRKVSVLNVCRDLERRVDAALGEVKEQTPPALFNVQ